MDLTTLIIVIHPLIYSFSFTQCYYNRSHIKFQYSIILEYSDYIMLYGFSQTLVSLMQFQQSHNCGIDFAFDDSINTHLIEEWLGFSYLFAFAILQLMLILAV